MKNRSKLLVLAGIALLTTAGLLLFADPEALEDTTGLVQSIVIVALLAFVVWFSSKLARRVSPNVQPGAKQGLGCAVGLGGLLLMFSPLLFASAGAAEGGNIYDESGAGGAIWLLMFSVPFGLIIGGIGLGIFVRATTRSKAVQQESIESKKGE